MPAVPEVQQSWLPKGFENFTITVYLMLILILRTKIKKKLIIPMKRTYSKSITVIPAPPNCTCSSAK